MKTTAQITFLIFLSAVLIACAPATPAKTNTGLTMGSTPIPGQFAPILSINSYDFPDNFRSYTINVKQVNEAGADTDSKVYFTVILSIKNDIQTLHVSPSDLSQDPADETIISKAFYEVTQKNTEGKAAFNIRIDGIYVMSALCVDSATQMNVIPNCPIH